MQRHKLRATSNLPTSLQLALPITWACALRMVTLPSSGGVLFGIGFNASYSGAGNCCQFYYNGHVSCAYNSAGSSKTFTSSVVGTAGTDYVFSATITPTTQILYINGMQVASTSNSISNLTYGSPAVYQIGCPTQNGSPDAGSLYYWGGVWNANFTAAQHAGGLRQTKRDLEDVRTTIGLGFRHPRAIVLRVATLFLLG